MILVDSNVPMYLIGAEPPPAFDALLNIADEIFAIGLGRSGGCQAHRARRIWPVC